MKQPEHPTIAVVTGDVTALDCDVLVLKYARAFFGVDEIVAGLLGLLATDVDIPPGKHLIVPSQGKLACRQVMFLGVATLFDFSYAQIRAFARDALLAIADTTPNARTIGMTMHGVGYGLDESEAFAAQVGGLLDFFAAEPGWRPEQIIVVERDPNRSQKIKSILEEILLRVSPFYVTGGAASPEGRLPDAGVASESKKHIFVAVPYEEEMEDVYEFGIREPINEIGCLCERCDRAMFTGDIIERIKARIASATLLVADMTGANSNVYLEVGYAWGKGKDTLLIARTGEELKFDVLTHKCIYYRNISDLRKKLRTFLADLFGDP